MTLFSKHALAWALAVTTLLGGMTVQAASKAAPKPATATAVKVSLLGGKLTFSLPSGYVASAMPPGEDNNASAEGTLYVNQAQKRVVIVAEHPLSGDHVAGDNDDAFLDGAVTGFIDQQSAALPDFKQESETRLTFKGLGVRQIDSLSSMGGGKTLNTTFLAGSGKRMAVVQVVSRVDDQAGHGAMVKQIIDSASAPKK
ncbi:hypothetical protein [Pseudomonas akapageensis]|uniref:hypothetical protein n=1 Tax=Pseudomonas akapageensis TaxID=2609961 RepID=UPI001407F694|nr:hypothetical protein [Pseudomonas akapageensis]